MTGEDYILEAIIRGDIDTVRQYIAKGGDVNITSVSMALLAWAADFGRYDCLQELIKAGADVNAKDTNGWTALMNAAQNGYIDCVRELISAGADVNLRNKNGWTALEWAMERVHYDVATTLVIAGADIYAPVADIFKQQGKCLIDYCKNKRVKERLIKLANKHVQAIIKSSDKPDLMTGFDTER